MASGGPTGYRGHRKTYQDISKQLSSQEEENKKLQEMLADKQEKIKAATKETDMLYKKITTAKQHHADEQDKVKAELDALREQNSSCKRMLEEFNAEKVEEKEETENELARTLEMLTRQLEVQKQEREDIKASTAELNSSFERVLSEKNAMEREMLEKNEEAKRNREMLVKAEEESEIMSRKLTEARSDLQKIKEQITAQDKEKTGLEEIRGLIEGKMADMSSLMEQIEEKLSTKIKEQERELAKTQQEFADFKKETKLKMDAKLNELTEKKGILRELEDAPPKKPRRSFLSRLFRFGRRRPDTETRFY